MQTPVEVDDWVIPLDDSVIPMQAPVEVDDWDTPLDDSLIPMQAPVEVDDWDTPLDALDDGHICPQYDISQGEPVGDEDCLR